MVLGILALLATFAAPQVLRYLGKARSETAKIQINAIASAVELYALDNGGYPAAADGTGALMQPPPGAVRWAGPYLKKAEGLVDPWGRPYQYRNPGRNGSFEIFTLGRDNAPGAAARIRTSPIESLPLPARETQRNCAVAWSPAESRWERVGGARRRQHRGVAGALPAGRAASAAKVTSRCPRPLAGVA